jgi:hypothetical protein
LQKQKASDANIGGFVSSRHSKPSSVQVPINSSA